MLYRFRLWLAGRRERVNWLIVTLTGWLVYRRLLKGIGKLP